MSLASPHSDRRPQADDARPSGPRPLVRSDARTYRPVMTSERREMRRLFADGMTQSQIARTIGRHRNCVGQHIADLKQARKGPTFEQERALQGLMTRALRNERLFSACNAALTQMGSR